MFHFSLGYCGEVTNVTVECRDFTDVDSPESVNELDVTGAVIDVGSDVGTFGAGVGTVDVDISNSYPIPKVCGGNPRSCVYLEGKGRGMEIL